MLNIVCENINRFISSELDIVLATPLVSLFFGEYLETIHVTLHDDNARSMSMYFQRTNHLRWDRFKMENAGIYRYIYIHILALRTITLSLYSFYLYKIHYIIFHFINLHVPNTIQQINMNF